MQGIVLELTDEQVETLKPLTQKINEIAGSGNKGMAVGQVYRDHIVCGVFDPETAQLFQKKAKHYVA